MNINRYKTWKSLRHAVTDFKRAQANAAGGAIPMAVDVVTPAATAQLIGRSFRSCLFLTQFFGLSSVMLGIYLSSEMDTGTGSMIALVSAMIFLVVAVGKMIIPHSIDRAHL